MREVDVSPSRWQPRWPYAALLLASLGWLGLIMLAPYTRARGAAAAPYLYLLFAPICHQLPERSFHLFGHPLAVCQRCFGLYLGFAAAALLLPHVAAARGLLLGRPRLLVLFALPLVLDVVAPANTWLTRVATGTVAALPIGLLAAIAVEQLPTSIRSVRERHAE